MSRLFDNRICGLWWYYIALPLPDVVLILIFSHLVVPVVGWMFLLHTGLLGKADRALGLAIDLRKQQTAHLCWL